MAFKFNWPKFDKNFVESTRNAVEQALNSGNSKPASIVDTIFVRDLSLGTVAPELEILEVGELSDERFRGFFQLDYKGDAYIILQTKIQANPISSPGTEKHSMQSSRRLYEGPASTAEMPLVLPMQLKISSLRFRGILVVSMNRFRGIKLFFKNDPLESVNVSSTFDNLPNIRRYLQNEIETQLRLVFLEVIPTMVYRYTSNILSDEQLSAHGSVELSHSDPRLNSPEKMYQHPSTPLHESKKTPISPLSNSNGEDFVKSPPHIRDMLVKQFMSPEKNSLTAELAQLMNSSCTLSPFGEQFSGHVAYRSDPSLYRSIPHIQNDMISLSGPATKLLHRSSSNLIQHNLDDIL